MIVPHRPTATVAIEPLERSVPIDAAIVSFAHATGAAILESSSNANGYGRFSILASDPIDEFVIAGSPPPCPFRPLAELTSRYPVVARRPSDPPFVGGWIGHYCYEAGLGIERIPYRKKGACLPLARFRLYDTAAIYDHEENTWCLSAIDWPPSFRHRRPSAKERIEALRNRLVLAEESAPTGPPETVSTCDPVPNMSRRAYFDRVEQAKRYIAAGDIYQVNLTQRFSARTDLTPIDLYRRLRRTNSSSHAAFLPWKDGAVISASPELFLLQRDGHVTTRPIKGTRPRGVDDATDLAMQAELSASEKDHAELAMIIDLLRNDLGRVCSYGSIKVTDTGSVEKHPTVFHRVATIEGDLAPGQSWVDLLRASFPGGSITGAPKIRAMQIINELELGPRGVYCGAIGWVGLDQTLCMNIAIRTMVQSGDRVDLFAGGAIVADSTPEAEYEETLAKAAGMIRALCSSTPAAERIMQEVPTL